MLLMSSYNRQFLLMYSPLLPLTILCCTMEASAKMFIIHSFCLSQFERIVHYKWGAFPRRPIHINPPVPRG